MEGDDAGTAISNLSLQELNMVKEQVFKLPGMLLFLLSDSGARSSF